MILPIGILYRVYRKYILVRVVIKIMLRSYKALMILKAYKYNNHYFHLPFSMETNLFFFRIKLQYK